MQHDWNKYMAWSTGGWLPAWTTMWKLQVCPCKCSGWSYPWPIFPTGVKSSSQAICGDHQRRLACDHGTLRPTGHYNMLLKLLKNLGWSKSSSQDGHFEPWNLRCTNRNLYRCKDCNMIPANTWPGWLPAVQCLPSSYLQWKHTETCRQLPLVQPFVSLVASSDWNQVWIGWSAMSDKLFEYIRIGRAALQIETAHFKQSSLIRCPLAFITNERPLLGNTVIHIKS